MNVQKWLSDDMRMDTSNSQACLSILDDSMSTSNLTSVQATSSLMDLSSGTSRPCLVNEENKESAISGIFSENLSFFALGDWDIEEDGKMEISLALQVRFGTELPLPAEEAALGTDCFLFIILKNAQRKCVRMAFNDVKAIKREKGGRLLLNAQQVTFFHFIPGNYPSPHST